MAMYLTHIPFITYIEKYLEVDVNNEHLYIPVVILISSICTFLIEDPIQKLTRKYVK